ncbi:transposase family protein [Streptomyces sp. NPDC050516]|uniref:transposase family protein n=1 Tax=Streptomyces sp. NPDC050516 TaxID=3365621 RepID=UPI0037B047FD
MLDVPHEVVEHVSWLIYTRRCELNSSWRRLGCFKQALLVLVYLRKNETLAQVGAGFEVSTATAGRYVTETVDVLAECAASLLDAVQDHDPNEFLILDGTLTRTDPEATDEPYYSMNQWRLRSFLLP